jgi:AraC-like DNA-binding protein
MSEDKPSRKALADALSDEIQFDIVLERLAREFGFSREELAKAIVDEAITRTRQTKSNN